jgi:hypothetical protein
MNGRGSPAMAATRRTAAVQSCDGMSNEEQRDTPSAAYLQPSLVDKPATRNRLLGSYLMVKNPGGVA